MTTQELLTVRRKLIDVNTDNSQALTDYCKPFQGNMGLISEECKQSDEYKQLKRAFDQSWHNLRQFNQATRKNKELQKAIKQEIMQRRMSKATR